MSGAITAAGVGLAASAFTTSTAAIVGSALAAGALTGSSYFSNKKRLDLQKQGMAQQQQAQDKAYAQAQEQKSSSEQAYNKANQKTADVGKLLRSERNASGGVGSTMLTGSQGVDESKMRLAKKTLLGG